MGVSHLIVPEDVFVGRRAANKSVLMSDMADLAAKRLSIGREAVLGALNDRERLGSTGLGRGFALPHARIPGLDRLFGLFVQLTRPIDFEAIDGQLVDLIFLLLIPAKSGGEHVAALAAIAREMRDEARLAAFRKAKSREALYNALIEKTTAKPPA